MPNVVGERYQITIDRAVRAVLGVRPGDLAVERVEDGRLVVDFIPAPKRESLFGLFHRDGMPPLTDWEAVREGTWTERHREQEAREKTAGSDDEP